MGKAWDFDMSCDYAEFLIESKNITPILTLHIIQAASKTTESIA